MASLTLALPILPGKLEAWRRFCQELVEGRHDPQQGLGERLGVKAVRAWLLRTSGGAVALLRFESEEPDQLLARLAASQHPSSRWLRRQLSELHSLDLEPGSLRPQLELVFELETA